MIIKGLIDQNDKVLDRGRLHLDNVTSPGKSNFPFLNENGDITEENVDGDLSLRSKNPAYEISTFFQ